ncbi:MAG: peptidoglycan bridge formation glycyltransferase FemA/FemB family protein [Bacteroidales bacterium]|nr:peptidoglycan bridge formation glycyltransferase FemA/FemB family protein [Bacteroidales bacterium]
MKISTRFIQKIYISSDLLALPKKFILSLLNDYDDGNKCRARLFVVYNKKKAIGASLLLGANNSDENLLFASLSEYNRMYTSYLLHWAMISYSIKKNANVYSFGRSTKDSGVHIYKKQWNTIELPVYWSYSHPLKKSIRDMKYLAGLYRMIPFSIAKKIGPWFAGRIYLGEKLIRLIVDQQTNNWNLTNYLPSPGDCHFATYPAMAQML